MKKLIIAAGLLMTTSAYAQTEVLTGVTRGKDYGVVYSLPKTQIELEIKANKVNYTPGEFSKYADRYLRLTNVSADPEEYWELASVKVKSVGVPNSETTYFVKLKDKTVAPLMELTEDGIVKTINVPYSNSSVGKKAAPAPAVLQKKANPREFLTEEILMASSTAKMAELVAKEIYNIRESKNALLRGQADNMPSDGAQLKIMLDNLNAQEEAMTQMFSGTCNKEERTFTVRLTPDKEFNNEVAFRFSKKLDLYSWECWWNNWPVCLWKPICNVSFMSRWGWNIQVTCLYAVLPNRKLSLPTKTVSCVKRLCRDLCMMRLPLSLADWPEMPDFSLLPVM